MEVFQEINLDLRNVSVVYREPGELPRATSTHLDHAQFALGHIAQFDLLDGHCLAGPPVKGLVDGPEGALPDAVPESLRTHSSAMSHFSQSGRTEKGKWSPWPAACSPESQRSRPRSRSDRFIQNKEAAAGCQATGRMVDAYVGPVGHACMRCMDGPCRLHLTTQNARTRRGKRKSRTGGGNGSGGCGIALGAETEDGRSSSSSSNKARRPLNLHSPSAPGPARPSPADGSVPGAACRASSRPRRRPFRLRHGGTAPRSCWGVQSFRGVSSAGPWRRPWCAIHGPGSDRCSPCPPPPSPA